MVVEGRSSQTFELRTFPNLTDPSRCLSVDSLQDGDINPFTLRPFTATYKKILEGRKKLPVYERMHEFYELVS